MHDGGVQTLFVDGSVHFIGDYVDIIGGSVGATPPGDFSVWDRLNLSCNGQQIRPDMY